MRRSTLAGVIGLSVVILFMALYYRLPGVLADVALLIYAVITLYGLFVAGTMTLVLVWYRRNRRVHRKEIEALLEIARSERH